MDDQQDGGGGGDAPRAERPDDDRKPHGEAPSKGRDLDRPQTSDESFAIDEHDGKAIRGPEGGERQHD